MDPRLGVTSLLPDPMSTGLAAALDQSSDDVRSLTFDTPSLEQPLEIIGSPAAEIYAELVEGDELNLVAKLCAVAPGGGSSLITRGWLNVKRPSPDPGQATGRPQPHMLVLQPIAYQVPAGHVLRLSISGADFPAIWPTLANPRFRLWTGEAQASCLRLPVIPPGHGQDPAMPDPDPSANISPLTLDHVPGREIIHDVCDRSAAVKTSQRIASLLPDGSGRLAAEMSSRYSAPQDRPDAARAEHEVTIHLHLDDGLDVAVTSHTLETRQTFRATAAIDLNGTQFFQRQWSVSAQDRPPAGPRTDILEIDGRQNSNGTASGGSELKTARASDLASRRLAPRTGMSRP